MERSIPSSDWVAYVVVLGTVAAMLIGKYLMFFNDKPNPAEELEETAEEIVEEAIDDVVHEVEEKIEEKIK